MIYKIGTIADVQRIAFEDEAAKRLCLHYATILSTEYGEKRNVDKDNGGYILYTTLGTPAEDVKRTFDYTENIPEFVYKQGWLCCGVYITSNDFGVVIIMSLVDAPPEMLKEIND